MERAFLRKRTYCIVAASGVKIIVCLCVCLSLFFLFGVGWGEGKHIYSKILTSCRIVLDHSSCRIQKMLIKTCLVVGLFVAAVFGSPMVSHLFHHLKRIELKADRNPEIRMTTVPYNNLEKSITCLKTII